MNNILKSAAIICVSVLAFELLFYFLKQIHLIDSSAIVSPQNFFPHDLNESTKYLLIGQWRYSRFDTSKDKISLNNVYIEFSEDGQCSVATLKQSLSNGRETSDTTRLGRPDATSVRIGRWSIKGKGLLFVFSDSTYINHYQFISPDDIAAAPLDNQGQLLKPNGLNWKLQRIDHTLHLR